MDSGYAAYTRCHARVLVALAMMAPPLRFLFDGVWLSATRVSFTVHYALMRPAAAADAHLTLALSEIR